MNEPINENLMFLTVEEFFAIYGDKDEYYELIDGIPYMMAAPNTGHQGLSSFLHIEIGNFLKGKKCMVFAAPYDVFLNESPKGADGKPIKNKRTKGTVVQPDLMVICDRDKIKPDGCHGAPDFVIEIESVSTKNNDKFLKSRKYFSSGVKEYWLIDPDEETVSVYKFSVTGKKSKKAELQTFTFEDKVKINIFEDFEIDFKELRI